VVGPVYGLPWLAHQLTDLPPQRFSKRGYEISGGIDDIFGKADAGTIETPDLSGPMRRVTEAEEEDVAQGRAHKRLDEPESFQALVNQRADLSPFHRAWLRRALSATTFPAHWASSSTYRGSIPD